MFEVSQKIIRPNWIAGPYALYCILNYLSTAPLAQLINLRRRREVAHVSITKLGKKITEAEAMKYELGIVDRARTLKEKVDTTDTEFKKHHFSIVELLDEKYIDAEQGVLDSHEDGNS